MTDLDVVAPSPAGLAERYFVGALLHLPADVTVAASRLVFPAWINDVHVAGVYAAMVALADSGAQTDPASVVPAMMRLGLPSSSAGVATGLVVDLLAGVPLPGNWRVYALEVMNARQRQRLEAVGRLLVERAHQDTLDRLHVVLDDAQAELVAMTQHMLEVVGGERA